MKSVWKKRDPRGIAYFVNHKIADFISRRSGALMRLRGNRQMAIFANDYIGIQINQFGYFEIDELTALFEYLAPLAEVFKNGIALDIGANIGNHAVFFSTRFRSVHAYEPNPRTHNLLKFNIDGLSNVTSYQRGLGDVRGSFELQQDVTSPGLASIKYNADSQAQSVSIQVETLDDLSLPDREALCFIKIDVEGFEENVVKGGAKTLRQFQPVVVLEQHQGEFTDKGTTPAIQELRNLGYSFCWEKKRRPARTWVGRRIQDLYECASGKQIEFVAADDVPPANYTMIIAVPERFKRQVGL
jgi:FkbM family methyltransferase